MSGIQLLDKTRKIGKLLHNSHSSKVVFNDICKVMQDALQSNVLVISFQFCPPKKTQALRRWALMAKRTKNFPRS